jgi:hypothetical protein
VQVKAEHIWRGELTIRVAYKVADTMAESSCHVEPEYGETGQCL